MMSAVRKVPMLGRMRVELLVVQTEYSKVDSKVDKLVEMREVTFA